MNGGTANYPATGTGTAAPSNFPPSPRKASTANGYPPTQNSYGATNDPYTNYPGNNVNQKAGFVNGNSNGYGNGYAQGSPVAYGPDGRPVAKKSHRLRNVIVGTLAVCCCCIVL